jgi:hypothetical protein
MIAVGDSVNSTKAIKTLVIGRSFVISVTTSNAER